MSEDEVDYYDHDEKRRFQVKVAVDEVRRWSFSEGRFWPAHETLDRLVPGFYKSDFDSHVGPHLKSMPVVTDDLIAVTGGASQLLVDEFDSFWRLADDFNKRGFIHKRGILMWGPPGSGKTASLMLMAKHLIDQGGIVVQIGHPGNGATNLENIRRIEPKRPIIAVLEDFECLVEKYGDEVFLALLDGEQQIDGVVFVATTNFPEKIGKRFVDRPSRFDTIHYVGMPEAVARRAYLLAKEPGLVNVDKWVAETAGFSMAHLRELVILTQCFGRPLDQAIARLEHMRTKMPDSRTEIQTPAWLVGDGKKKNGNATSNERGSSVRL